MMSGALFLIGGARLYESYVYIYLWTQDGNSSVVVYIMYDYRTVVDE